MVRYLHNHRLRDALHDRPPGRAPPPCQPAFRHPPLLAKEPHPSDEATAGRSTPARNLRPPLDIPSSWDAYREGDRPVRDDLPQVIHRKGCPLTAQPGRQSRLQSGDPGCLGQ